VAPCFERRWLIALKMRLLIAQIIEYCNILRSDSSMLLRCGGFLLYRWLMVLERWLIAQEMVHGSEDSVAHCSGDGSWFWRCGGSLLSRWLMVLEMRWLIALSGDGSWF
jgi:hypothetical protein